MTVLCCWLWKNCGSINCFLLQLFVVFDTICVWHTCASGVVPQPPGDLYDPDHQRTDGWIILSSKKAIYVW